MSDKPFGFGFGAGDDDSDPADRDRPAGGGIPAGFGAGDPFGALLGGFDPNDLGAAFQRLGQLMSYQGGPVNWDLARDTARQAVASGSDRSVGVADRAAVADAVRLADHWLDEVTALPSGAASTAAWSRAEWVEGTLTTWKQLMDPVAAKVVDALGGAMTDSSALAEAVPEEMRAQLASLAGPMRQMMASMGGAMFGAQVGQALGSLAGEVVSSTDVGLPLGPAGTAILVPANVEAFGAGLGLPADQVRLYLALREAAHQRLFTHVPWLRGRLLAAVEEYARGISIDTGRIQEQLAGLDASDPEALQQALGSGLFEPDNTPGQEAALRRLEGLLALVEGWVDAVVDAAASPRLAAAAALRETVRRRRATGGPAEETFAALVGLELRPRRLREAAALWAAVTEARGSDGRDALWEHPDLLPTIEDFDDPAGFARSGSEVDMSGLDELLDGPADPPGDEPPAPAS